MELTLGEVGWVVYPVPTIRSFQSFLWFGSVGRQMTVEGEELLGVVSSNPMRLLGARWELPEARQHPHPRLTAVPGSSAVLDSPSCTRNHQAAGSGGGL